MCFVPLLTSLASVAESLHVAVASNFQHSMKELAVDYKNKTGQSLILSYGSSGKLFAQILHGAPYQVFLSADQDKPDKLIQKNLAVADSRFTYAHGRLALWSNRPGAAVSKDAVLRLAKGQKLAIANPKLAPYGLAASQVLRNIDAYEAIKSNLVQADNISQTFQFVSTQAAKFGFVALSQLYVKGIDTGYWIVPMHLHDTIKQDAVLLTAGKSSLSARRFLDFMSSQFVKDKLVEHGYFHADAIVSD